MSQYEDVLWRRAAPVPWEQRNVCCGKCSSDTSSQSQLYRCCCRPLPPARLITASGTSITGTATASCPAIISRPATVFQYILDILASRQTAARHPILILEPRAIGGAAATTISAIPVSTAVAITAEVLVRAGHGLRSGQCGIAARPGSGTSRALTPRDTPPLDQTRARREGGTTR
jgi:hypothetical protein